MNRRTDTFPFKARWWMGQGDELLCTLCPRACTIKEGRVGFCRARKNISGRLYSLTYGKVCVKAIDQIEKKPIFHYRPGSKLLSIGTFGCNMACDFCQNAILAEAADGDVECERMLPEDIVEMAIDQGVDGVAFTFNEPTVWSEFMVDVGELAHRAGLYVMMNTNGFIAQGALEDILPTIDAFKIDIKGFSEEGYERICSSSLRPVLSTCETVIRSGNHLEIAYLAIEGSNCDEEGMQRFLRWYTQVLGVDVPLHIYRFLPAHRMADKRGTEPRTIEGLVAMARKSGLHYVYPGGMMEDGDKNTICPECGATVIARSAAKAPERILVGKESLSKFCPSYVDISDRTEDGKCRHCGHKIYDDG